MPARLAVYPEYGEAKRMPSRSYFGVRPEQFVFTNGTDEAIQVFVNTYVDDGQEVLLLKPSYAMYRFYAEVAGAADSRDRIPAARHGIPARQQLLDAITPETRAVLLANPNNPTGTGISLLGIERILHRARKAAVLVDEAYYEFSGVTALRPDRARAQPVRQPHVFEGVRHGRPCGWAACFRTRPISRFCTRRSRPTA